MFSILKIIKSTQYDVTSKSNMFCLIKMICHKKKILTITINLREKVHNIDIR